MRLADFIGQNRESILKEWETFARTLPAAEDMTQSRLRDHAPEILSAVVQDMDSRQTREESVAKSKGEKPSGHLGALGELHALLRIESGFTLVEVIAEYRALRASVLRLWGKSNSDAQGVLRFNEAIDEALSEAVVRYADQMKQYEAQVIAIVSHDLRNPLGGILAGTAVLLQTDTLDDRMSRIAVRIESSATRMKRIVDDLLDLSHTRLGSGIPVFRRPTDLGPICEMVIAELEGTYPHAVIRYAPTGDLRGEWDSDRLAQVLSNLVANALQHGHPSEPVTVVARGDGADVVLSVHNGGSPIPRDALKDVFEPLFSRSGGSARAGSGLGLGLYITKHLVVAHGGNIEATSEAGLGTTFTVRLPRRPTAAANAESRGVSPSRNDSRSFPSHP